MKILIYTILFLNVFNATFSQSNKILIIDSDAGTDDYRALILLSSLKNYEIKAITLSDGTLFPDKGAYRTESLLNCLNILNISIGTGKKTIYNKPLWRKYAETIPWSSCYKETNSIKNYPFAKVIIEKILQQASFKSVTFACLGSLSNIYEVLKDKKELSEKIEKIVWYNTPDIIQGTNYLFAPKAADYVLSLSIPIYLIHAIPHKHISYSSNFLKKIESIANIASNQLYYQLNYFYKNNDTTHLKLWDELIPIFLANQNIFTLKVNQKQPNVHYAIDYNTEHILNTYLKMLDGSYKPIERVIFSTFPIDSSFYRDDVNEIKNELINRYGFEEFVLSVLTSEIHGHLGIYSLIGVKMGLLAREILQAPLNEIKVTSYAGKLPPLSCLNDGIMISTASTPAINYINIDTSETKPTALFRYKEKFLIVTLKDDIYSEIKKEIEKISATYGISSYEYLKNIRKLALHYWLSLDRKNIFDIKLN